MAFRTLLAPIGGNQNDKSSMSAALQVGDLLGAHVEVVFPRLDPDDVSVYLGMDPGNRDAAIAELRTRVEEEVKAAAARSRRQFNAICREANIKRARKPDNIGETSAYWQEAVGDPIEVVSDMATFTDLSVFSGGEARYGRLSENILEHSLLRSARPVLFIPDNAGKLSFSNVVVAWDASSPCTRAVKSAMPILKMADSVCIVSVSEPYEEPVDPKKIVNYLKWHGIVSSSEVFSSTEQRVGKVICDISKKLNADLLVMGGYGHYRYQEAIFGGATSHLLRKSACPVFLMH